MLARIKFRNCQRCGIQFEPTAFHQKFCGTQRISGSCSRIVGDEKRAKWIAENKTTYDKQRKDWATKNADRVRHLDRLKVYRRYGITEADYLKMLESQGGVCAICKEPPTASNQYSKMKLAIDHDHATGKVRGLLCFTCNTRLGHMDSGWIKLADEYLEAAKRA